MHKQSILKRLSAAPHQGGSKPVRLVGRSIGFRSSSKAVPNVQVDLSSSHVNRTSEVRLSPASRWLKASWMSCANIPVLTSTAMTLQVGQLVNADNSRAIELIESAVARQFQPFQDMHVCTV